MEPQKPFDIGHELRIWSFLAVSALLSPRISTIHLHSLLFGMVVFYHWMLEVCNLLLDFYKGTRARRLPWVLEELSSFELLNTISLEDCGDFWSWLSWLSAFCIMSGSQAYGVQGVESDGLDENGSQMFMCLDTGSQLVELFVKN